MMPSRGMGDIAPSKMPTKKVITRKDDPNKVDVYADGGVVKKKKKTGRKPFVSQQWGDYGN